MGDVGNVGNVGNVLIGVGIRCPPPPPPPPSFHKLLYKLLTTLCTFKLCPPPPKSLLCLWYFWNTINTGPRLLDPQGSVFIVSHNTDNAGGAGLHYARDQLVTPCILCMQIIRIYAFFKVWFLDINDAIFDE